MSIKDLRSTIERLYRSYIQRYSHALESQDRQKLIGYLYIIFTLATVSFFGLFAINPTLSTVSNLKKQYQDNKLIYESLKKKSQSLQTLDSLYQQVEPDLPSLLVALPTSMNIPHLTRQIEKLAASNRVTILKLDFNRIELYPAKKANQPLYSFTFSLALEGDAQQVDEFISEFIDFERAVSLERITTGKTGADKFGASLVGRAYFLNAP